MLLKPINCLKDNKLKPFPHQVEYADKTLNLVRELGFAYIAFEERCGKTLTAILAVEASTRSNILVLTKKSAIPDWEATLNKSNITKSYTVRNYEQAHKLKAEYDFIILDEAHHALSKYPKPSETWKNVKVLCADQPIIFLSATPYAETTSQIYHQFALSSWSPFEETSFYKWHKNWGIESSIRVAGREIKQYNLVKDYKLLPTIQKYFLRLSRSEIGFEHEPEDKIHYVELTEGTKELYSTLEKHRIAHTKDDIPIIADTPGGLMQKLSQLVGGTMITEDKAFFTGNTEKIDYIKSCFGDCASVAIMHNYKLEKQLLEHHFSKALILQGDKYAEGVDLSHIEHLVIYSMSFRTSKYIQRRARQANKNRNSPIVVHYILSGLIDTKVYDAVAIKRSNFTARLYNE